ncbi:enoyl-CoA hydratase family protein [Rhodococcus rhodnii]|nr:enoyl-CoA hydratase family protein [Rhodococcus rhodnii]TXG92882.1 enoyl-CoA hydratase family protein [Rhodococcus rhodnii]
MTTAPDVRVHYDVANAIATVTLDSPHNRNALSDPLVTGIEQSLADAAADPDVRAVVLTHTGGTFCAGADLSRASADVTERSLQMARLLRAIVALPKPVIAHVDGHVRAGGMGLVAACDIAIAGPSSSFALTEARLGLAASIISLTVLPRITPRAAARYFLTGERFDAAEAQRIGLVTLAADDPAAAVAAVAADLRTASPQGLEESKRLVTREILAGFDAHSDDLAARSARLFESDEAREGMMAFLQKRAPRWADAAR